MIFQMGLLVGLLGSRLVGRRCEVDGVDHCTCMISYILNCSLMV